MRRYRANITDSSGTRHNGLEVQAGTIEAAQSKLLRNGYTIHSIDPVHPSEYENPAVQKAPEPPQTSAAVPDRYAEDESSFSLSRVFRMLGFATLFAILTCE